MESLLGLFPGFGDAAGAALGGWIFLEAVRRGAKTATLVRMAANLAIDTLVGAIPVLGDLFDFAWKANLRNMALLERMAAEPSAAHRADRRFVALLTVAIVVICAAPILGGLALLLHILSLLAAR